LGGVLRLAGLLHMATHAGDPSPWDHAVTAETYVAARRIGAHAIPHAEATFALMGADPAVEGAKHILAWLTRKRSLRLTVRDLFNGVRGHFQRMDALQGPMKLLAQHLYIRWVDEPRAPGPGSPPSPTFEVNPHAYDPGLDGIADGAGHTADPPRGVPDDATGDAGDDIEEELL
jgi:hypothetical protein